MVHLTQKFQVVLTGSVKNLTTEMMSKDSGGCSRMEPLWISSLKQSLEFLADLVQERLTLYVLIAGVWIKPSGQERFRALQKGFPAFQKRFLQRGMPGYNNSGCGTSSFLFSSDEYKRNRYHHVYMLAVSEGVFHDICLTSDVIS